jgi:DNA-directed RNA polymerase subunit RPC12/RpoP
MTNNKLSSKAGSSFRHSDFIQPPPWVTMGLAMIKFVCSSCGERLSVPDQHAGRRGVCPNCHALNRIPLKGMPPQTLTAQNQSAQAAVAKTVEAPPPAKPAIKVPADIAERSGRIEGTQPTSRLAMPSTSVAPSRPVPAPIEPSPFALPPQSDEPAEMVELRKERRIPKPVKTALLIIAALVLVSALYFGLRFALNAALKSMQ